MLRLGALKPLFQNDIIMTNLRMTFMTLRDDDIGIYGYAKYSISESATL